MGLLIGVIFEAVWYLYNHGTFGHTHPATDSNLRAITLLFSPGLALISTGVKGVEPVFEWALMLVALALLLNGLIYMAAGWLLAFVYESLLKPSTMRRKIVDVVRSANTKLALSSLLLLSILIALGIILHRHHQMADLYEKALKGPTSDAEAAVVELGTFHGEEPTDLLLRLASPKSRFLDDRQTFAVQILAKQHDPRTTARLAQSLKPYSSLALRRDVSQALLETECNLACTQSLLQYLERLSHGELNEEEAFEQDPDFRSSIRTEQDKIVRTLHRVLAHNQELTQRVLVSDYGLGSDYPSRFAVQLAGSAQIQSTCPFLDNSSSQTFDGALREQIHTVMQQLRCPSSRH